MLFVVYVLAAGQPENVVCKHMKKIRKIILRNIEHRISLGNGAGPNPQNGNGSTAEEDEDSDGEDLVRLTEWYVVL